MPEPLDPREYRDLVRAALAEDVGTGDVTTRAIVEPTQPGRGTLVAKAPLVVCGLPLVRHVFTTVDASTRMHNARGDGDLCVPGDILATVTGPAAALLVAERTALNFLQYLSGIATLTRTFVDAAGSRLKVLDTRKTTPGLRALAKYAVRCGGGTNHRLGLYDAILIKDNHIRLAGSVTEALRLAREAAPGLRAEVETQTMAEVDEAVAAGADIIMLDNFDDIALQAAIARVGGRAQVEVSGNMTIERVKRLAGCGADFVSVGALTHSAPAADISFEIDVRPSGSA